MKTKRWTFDEQLSERSPLKPINMAEWVDREPPPPDPLATPEERLDPEINHLVLVIKAAERQLERARQRLNGNPHTTAGISQTPFAPSR